MSNNPTDRSNWGAGKWDDEPDFIDGIDDDTGYDMVIRRGPLGGLCGYVGLPKGHPAYGEDYDNIDVVVHGGLTYSDEDTKDSLYWVGFDCAHMNDLVPGLAAMMSNSGGTYRDMEYVKGEVISLAKQLKDMVKLIAPID